METLNNIPKILDKGKFYCYDTRKGYIAIGEIIGKSILSNSFLLRIRNKYYKSFFGFSEERRILDIAESNWRGFLDYEDFEKDYKDKRFSGKKIRKRPQGKLKFLVHKILFYCLRTYSEPISNEFRIFEKEKDALEYSKKGLLGLKISAELNLTKIEKLEEILTDNLNLFLKAKNSEKRLSDFRVKPSDLTTGENLFMIRFKGYNDLSLSSFLEVVSSFEVGVTEISANQEMATLSDGSFLLHDECGAGFPILCKCKDRKEIENLVNLENYHKLLSIIEREHKHLEDTISYCEKYIPFLPYYERKGFSKNLIIKLYIVAKDLDLLKECQFKILWS